MVLSTSIIIGADNMTPRAKPLPLNAPDAAQLAAQSPLFHGLVRGLLPLFVLVLLRDGPLHGIDVMRSVGTMTGGKWKPSPGSIYPLLRRLEQDGLITGSWQRSRAAPKRVYRLTARGRADLPETGRSVLGELYGAQRMIHTHITALEAVLDLPHAR
jgi:DNA-binding PadR family transcriptional regulator